MKYLNLVLIFAISIMLSCVKDDTNIKTSLPLTSPQGVVISDSEAKLKSYIAPTVWQLIGKKEDFDITTIEYKENRLETAALIRFESTSGLQGNLALQILVDEFGRQLEIYKVFCTGDYCCETTITISGGDSTYTCGCSGCSISREPD